ncbi:MAG TPA: TadE family protein [Pyrinomonadaceae bacterium]|nr:TadE family protein [Pyrinomonadaceae bacterium]
MKRKKLFSSNECGATLVEFAIAITVFLTAMFAVIEFGRALYTHNALADAARRGTRYATIHQTSEIDQVKNVVVYGDPAGGTQPLIPNLSTSNVSVNYSNFGVNKGTVSVSVTDYQFQFVLPLVSSSITMPNYTTTLTGESSGYIPVNK